MYPSIDAFAEDWKVESASTLKLFHALTDASLHQQMTSEHRSLGRLAWHVVLSIGEMMGRTGLAPECPHEDAPIPATAKEIADAYARAAHSLITDMRAKWTDASLAQKNDMYGFEWENGLTLQVLVRHEIHHRAQMTVLMRQAGLAIPGLYGPAKEEWAAMGMPAAD